MSCRVVSFPYPMSVAVLLSLRKGWLIIPNYLCKCCKFDESLNDFTANYFAESRGE